MVLFIIILLSKTWCDKIQAYTLAAEILIKISFCGCQFRTCNLRDKGGWTVLQLKTHWFKMRSEARIFAIRKYRDYDPNLNVLHYTTWNMHTSRDICVSLLYHGWCCSHHTKPTTYWWYNQKKAQQSCACINTLRSRQKMDAISQTTFSNEFSWMKIFEFRLKFHWSLFLRFQLTIFQHWFRKWLGADQATSHYLNQWRSVYWRIYASLGLNELTHRGRMMHTCVSKLDYHRLR